MPCVPAWQVTEEPFPSFAPPDTTTIFTRAPFFSCSSILRQGITLGYIKRLKFEIVDYHSKAIQWPGWMIRSSNSEWGKTLIYTNQGVDSTSYTSRYQDPSPQVRRLGREADHPSPFSARLRRNAAHTPSFFIPSRRVQGKLYLVNFMLFVAWNLDYQFTILNQENAQFSSLGIYTVSTFVKYVGCSGDAVHEDLISLQYTTISQSTVYALLLHSATVYIKC